MMKFDMDIVKDRKPECVILLAGETPANISNLNQEAEVQRHVDCLTNNIQDNEDQSLQNNDTTIEVDIPEVQAMRPIFGKTQQGQSEFVSCSLETWCNIPDKIKEQIWAGRYIEFHSLLEDKDTKYKLQLVQGAHNPELSITEERNRKALSLNQWLTTWNKFTALICTKKP
ncbi:unnamed protein product [Mytilus coruscus]|uniref:Uncharacterized protein n=1 Tax=Mytilus coruscus TaxID=42192 RepID=A0A6J8DDD4_MYTCO|nr:unnamed protein product [Mytilus coruscus]